MSQGFAKNTSSNVGNGLPGTSGTSGNTGGSGTSGTSGNTGTSGTSGTAGTSGTSTSFQQITQTAHGFGVAWGVRKNESSSWERCQAVTANNISYADAVVATVVDANNFTIALPGDRIVTTGLGLLANTVYVESASASGINYSNIPPGLGFVYRELFKTDTPNDAVVLNTVGYLITSSNITGSGGGTGTSGTSGNSGTSGLSSSGSIPSIPPGTALANNSGSNQVAFPVQVPIVLQTLTTVTSQSVVNIDFSAWKDTYNPIEVQILSFQPFLDSNFYVRISSDGTNYLSTNYKYRHLQGNTLNTNPSSTQITICDFLSSGSKDSASGVIKVFHPGRTDLYPSLGIYFDVVYGDGNPMPIHSVGNHTSASSFRAIQLSMVNGLILSCSYRILGHVI